MSKIVNIKHDDRAPPPPAVIDDCEVWKLAMKYDLRMAQIRGLNALYGNNASKLAAAAKRLTAVE